MTHEKSPFYTPVESIKVPGYGHPHVQGIEIDIPFSPFSPQNIVPLCEMGIESDNTIENTDITLRKISRIHGRSYEFGNGQKIVWADEYGNIYTTLNTKGNNLTSPSIYLDSSNDLGFNVNGLQTSVGIARQLKASHILRKAGIETEAITHVIEPLALPYNGELVPVEEFKLQLQNKFVEEAPLDKKGEAEAVIAKTLANVSFFETVRSVQVNERLHDFTIMPKDLQEQALVNTFYYTNLYEKQKAKKDPTHQPKSFDSNDPQSIENYLHEYLPRKIGKNYAKLHSLGLVHKFPTLSNINLAGAIVDLDSIQGHALGDDPESIDNIFDLNTLLTNISQSVSPLVTDMQRFAENALNGYVQEAMNNLQYIDLHSDNIDEVVCNTLFFPEENDIKTQYEFFEYALEQAPLPQVDVEHIAQEVYNSPDISAGAKYSVFYELLQGFAETGYDKSLRHKVTKNGIFKLLFAALDSPLEDTPYDEIYQRITKQKIASLLDTHREIVTELFGKNPDTQPLSREDDQVYVKCAYKTMQLLRWDTDVAKHAFDIDHLLQLGKRTIGENDARWIVLADVFGKLAQQTGITFSWNQNKSININEFHIEDQKKAEDFERLKKKYDEPNLDPLTFSLAEFDRYSELEDYFNSTFPQDRYINSTVGKIVDWQEKIGLREVLFQECGNAEDTDTIMNWFMLHAAHGTVDTLTPKQYKRIDRTTNKRLERAGYQKTKEEKKKSRRKLIR